MFHAYVQNILPEQDYVLRVAGQDSSPAGRSYFGQREAIVGTTSYGRLRRRWRSHLIREANGGCDARGRHGESINRAALFGRSAPMRTNRRRRSSRLGSSASRIASGRRRLNYSLTSLSSSPQLVILDFRSGGFITNLQHQFPLYRTTQTYAPREFNGPRQLPAGRQRPEMSFDFAKSGG